ncbi:response regulator [Pontibacter anaerobius]|uniref:Response regulator n=1 Tax=Pontibacter anaerobius TaxID=2993940 RepID=A0ABT3RG20_9BACT|nr:response regulator [Pontibacter anaerobius]MCX2740302.1 response regulator [Pontibacter anaerobius]
MFRSVYIIDDDEVSAFLTEAMLTAENFSQRYHTFLNPCDALQQLLPSLQFNQSHKIPDVIFLDLNMPFINGWEFLDAVAPHAPQLRCCCLLYMLTSSLDIMEVRRAQEYDFLSGFLHKPLEESIIHNILKHS